MTGGATRKTRQSCAFFVSAADIEELPNYEISGTENLLVLPGCLHLILKEIRIALAKNAAHGADAHKANRLKSTKISRCIDRNRNLFQKKAVVKLHR